MCRLYGFRATHPTRVDCSLVHAQNALLLQSFLDEEGNPNRHGWGIGSYGPDGHPVVEKEPSSATQSRHFIEAAERAVSDAIVSHVRRATVGGHTMTNTHPFVHDGMLFAHNGTIGAFPRMKRRLLSAMNPENQVAVHGQTDSEHLFHYLASIRSRSRDREMVEVLREGLLQVLEWSRELDRTAPIALNVLWTDGKRLVGSRYRRTLHYLVRRGVTPCPVCGERHADPDDGRLYRSVTVASERITDEEWLDVPDESVFSIDPEEAFWAEPLAVGV